MKIGGNLRLDPGVTLKIVRVSWWRRAVLVECVIADDQPQRKWLRVAEALRCRIDVDIES